MASRRLVTDTDKGWNALKRRIQIAAQGAHVDVGILGEDATRLHAPEKLSDSERKELRELNALAKRKNFSLTAASHERRAALERKTQSSITIGEIGEIHEFGLGNNPVRSWLRATIDSNRAGIAERIRRVGEKVVQGSMTKEQGLGLVGLAVVGMIQRRIAAGIEPQVTARTQARKGPDKTVPLINSGQFRASIKAKVEPGA